MTYLTEKNDRRHRRNAKLMTALIMFSLILAFAYSSGALDQLLLEFVGPADPVASTTSVPRA